MVLSKEAEQNRPRRPLNAYFTYRINKLKELADDSDRNDKIKKMWIDIDPKLKDNLEKQYKNDILTFDDRQQAWKRKFKVSDEDMIKKSNKNKKKE